MSEIPKVPLPYQSGAMYYRHSGAVSIPGLCAGLIGSVIFAMLFGAIYAYTQLYIPFIYIHILLTVFFGMAVGYATTRLMQWGKVRNSSVFLLSIILVTMAAYYFCWIFWIFALTQKIDDPIEISELFLNPGQTLSIIGKINEVGTWSLGHSSDKSNSAVSGFALTIVWIIEAGIIFAASLVTAAKMESKKIFCETCNQWSPPPKTLLMTSPGNLTAIREHLENRDFEFVPQLVRVSGGDFYWQWDHNQCAQCKGLNTLTVSQVTITRNKKGQATKKYKVLIRKLTIDAADAARFTP